jgi:pimeloyl-ACP methyl ester carboxylesterase
MTGPSVRILTTEVALKNKTYSLEYFVREGPAATILFVHGLGGAKENFLEASKSHFLNKYRLVAFDNPGTGNSTYYEDDVLQIDDLIDITAQFVQALKLEPFILAGASMGGLITLLYLRSHLKNVLGYINIEGNLMPEDCMFSSKVVKHSQQSFIDGVFAQTISDMKNYGNPGYHIIANNLQMNTNPVSYYHYSFQTVRYSSTGELLNHFIELRMPKMFLYGDRNRKLSYIQQLRSSGVLVKEIPDSDHFIFYDNPVALYEAIAQFAAGL